MIGGNFAIAVIAFMAKDSFHKGRSLHIELHAEPIRQELTGEVVMPLGKPGGSFWPWERMRLLHRLGAMDAKTNPNVPATLQRKEYQ